jgi:hypothetical protein
MKEDLLKEYAGSSRMKTMGSQKAEFVNVSGAQESIPSAYVAWGAGSTNPEMEFLNNLWGLGTEYEKGYRTGPPGGWRNSV